MAAISLNLNRVESSTPNLFNPSISSNVHEETIVFVSYVREDNEAANQLCVNLSNANLNLKPWKDTEGILGGQKWEDEIKKAIQVCRYFIPLISSRAVEKKGYTKKEFEFALKVIKETQKTRNIIVIPVRMNECKIPYSQLEKIQYVDMFPDWKVGFEKLLQAIKRGDNLVGGHQFEEQNFGRMKTLQVKLTQPFRRKSTLQDVSLSASALRLLDSNMILDTNEIANYSQTNFHARVTFSSRFGFNSGSAGSKDGQFDKPTGIAMDGSSKYVYVADKDNHRIQKFDSSGRFITKWGSKGSSDGQIKNPTGIAIDPITDHVYVADKDNHRIQKFDSSGRFITKWGSKGSSDGQFSNPTGIAVEGSSKYVYVADKDNHRIQKFDSSGRFITKWGSKGSSDGQFSNPTGIAVEGSSKYVYVADKDNHRIQKFDSSGRFITKWGLNGRLRSSGSSDGQFDNPTGIAIDPLTDHVYVADKDNHRIQKFDSSGRFITKWGSKGSSDGQFSNPESVCINRLNGSIFVVEPNNHRIQFFVIPLTDEWIRKGTILFSSRKYNDALECFDKAIEIDQKYAYAWMNKGTCYYQLGNFNDALECFDKAIEIDQKYAYAWMNKGTCYYQLGNFNDALECFDKAIEIDQKYAYAWMNRGKSLVHEGNYREAIKSLEKSVEINQYNTEARIDEGLAYDLLNEYDKAIKYFTNVLEIVPGNESALYFRGCSKIKKGKNEDGLRDLSNAVRINRDLLSFAKEEGLGSIAERLYVMTGDTLNRKY